MQPHTLRGAGTTYHLEIDPDKVTILEDGQIATGPPSWIAIADPDDRLHLPTTELLDTWLVGADRDLEEMGVRVLRIVDDEDGEITRSAGVEAIAAASTKRAESGQEAIPS